MGCTVVQILMSVKFQNPATILTTAKTLMGVSIAFVRRGTMAMARKTEQVAILKEKPANPGLSLLHYVSI